MVLELPELLQHTVGGLDGQEFPAWEKKTAPHT